MEAMNVYRIFAISTFTLFLTSLFVPVAEITILAQDPDSELYLQFVCVFCQYGDVDSQAAGVSFVILRLTPFSFYNTWILNLILIFSSAIAVIQSFPKLNVSFLTAKRAMYSSWFVGITGILYRGLLSILLWAKIDYYKLQYPASQVLGDLSWAMGGVIIGALFAIATAMLNYIIFHYDDDPLIVNNNNYPQFLDQNQ